MKKNRFLKQKKGDVDILAPETLKLIISAICIIGLIALLTGIIYLFISGGNKLNYAKAVVSGDNGLKKTIEKINSEGGSASFSIPNPSGWGIFSFTGTSKKPNSCAGSNCLCLCPGLSIGVFNVDERQASKCDSSGICIAVANLKKFDTITIAKGGTSILIESKGGAIEITENGA